jgi:hypothetical protein
MYRPSLENFRSEMDEIISEKKDLLAGSSSSWNTNKTTINNKYEKI